MPNLRLTAPPPAGDNRLMSSETAATNSLADSEHSGTEAVLRHAASRLRSTQKLPVALTSGRPGSRSRSAEPTGSLTTRHFSCSSPTRSHEVSPRRLRLALKRRRVPCFGTPKHAFEYESMAPIIQPRYL
jgi:hypothetical protein